MMTPASLKAIREKAALEKVLQDAQKTRDANVVPPENLPDVERFYSAQARGFFSTDLHAKEKLPADAVPITHDEWVALLEAQTQGKEIVPDSSGKPAARNPQPSVALQRAQIAHQLQQLDAKSMRAMREDKLGIAAQHGTPTAEERFRDYENQAVELRKRLADLK